MVKPFSSFPELVIKCELNVDYRIQVMDRGAQATIICIHGGTIEPLTSELAGVIAGDEYNLYDLQGLRMADSRQLRIPVSRFDEVRLYTLLKRSQIAVSIDGVPGAEPVVHLGGGNAALKQILCDQLAQSGYQIAAPYTPGASHDPTRCYNSPRAGGILLELSDTLRCEMTTEPITGKNWQQPSSWQCSFYQFTNIVRSALLAYTELVDSNLDRALNLFEQTTHQFPRELRLGQHPRERS